MKTVDEKNMFFGVNDINQETKTVGKAHNLGKSKVILLHTQNKKTQKEISLPQIKKEILPLYDLNKQILLIIVIGIGWILFRR